MDSTTPMEKASQNTASQAAKASGAGVLPWDSRSSWGKTLRFFLRPVEIIASYRREDLQPDLIAGLTVAVIMLPQAIAFALIAELPPEMGLYAAILGAIFGGLWGSSHQLQTGPTNTTSLLVLSTLIVIATPGTPTYLVAASLLALMVGFFRLIMGVARLGVMVNFVSDAVIVGFTAGAGLLIFFNQLRHLFGLEFASAPGLAATIQRFIANLPSTNAITLAIGLGTIAVLLLLRRFAPRLPGPLLVMVLTSLIVGLFGLARAGVDVIEQLPSGLPPLTEVLRVDPGLVTDLLSGALAVAAIGLVESMSIARVIASQTRQPLDSNQEFVGQGFANLASGFFSGYPVSGSFTRSAVNFEAGARTAMASVMAGLMVLAGMLLLAPLGRYIPLAALAGVLILTAFGLIDIPEMKRIWRSGHADRWIMVATLLATLLLPLQYAVLSGIAVSLVYYLLKTSEPRVRTVLPDPSFSYLVPSSDGPTCPQFGIIEVLGDLYFGAVHHVEDCIRENLAEHPSQRFLLLRMHASEHLDISGIHALEGIVDAYRERNGDVFISRARGPVRQLMRSAGFEDYLGTGNFVERDQDAIGHIFHRVLDPAICIYECPVRAFRECQNLPKREDLIGSRFHLDVRDQDIETITPRALWDELHSGRVPQIIDVREPREFTQGHIAQADSLPLPELIENPEHLPDDHPIILVCRGGRRSRRAAGLLREKGLGNLRVLEGGMVAWEAANLLEAVHPSRKHMGPEGLGTKGPEDAVRSDNHGT